jgi:hypothetical protein
MDKTNQETKGKIPETVHHKQKTLASSIPARVSVF